MANLGVTFPLRQMTTYEQCMKVGVMLTPYIELNDCKKDTRHEVTKEMIAQWMQEKLLMDEPKEGEGIGQGELRGVGMMGKWMEARGHMGIGITLIASSPSNAC